MKLLLALALTAALAAQSPPRPRPNDWRRSLQNLPTRPSAGVTLRDIEQVEDNLRLAAPILGAATPENWEANRDLVRRTVSYLAAVHAMNNDPSMRSALSRAFISVAALQWAYRDQPGEDPPSPSPPPSAPPSRFAPRAPETGNLPEADREAAGELRERYDLAVAQASVAFQLAEGIERNLANRGMSLNATTATSLARLPLYFDNAADAMLAHQWAKVRTQLERAEYETEKVLKTVGR